MSNPLSIANFYVDENGIEQPVVYKAKHLVNHPAPPGYHWEKDYRAWRAYQALRLDNPNLSPTIEGQVAYLTSIREGRATEEENRKYAEERHPTILHERERIITEAPPKTNNYICVKDAE